ncbi:DUF3558 domain-containing protein [Actinophytocola xanthii]|uniref:DUF3558 domain-containing protein n=1 Tax=Actinophytocola xanthii TaxID=1912961 RepID=A0A1Q8CWC9_9PSEU|nr:hypothetical protein [Actinophytocola xanthii]OLF18659.1 hypothetical protein BU204_05195 [Actinophytocola xanthii]
MARWAPLALVFLVALLGGCSARVGGLPVAEKGVAIEGPATALDALGELTTIDPCSLTDLTVFDDFGTAEFETPSSLDYCTVAVAQSPGQSVWVAVGELSWLSERPDVVGQKLEDISEELYTVQTSKDSTSCAQGLVFAEEDLLLEVTSTMYGSPSDHHCEITQVGMEQVVATIEQDGVEHRSPEPDSLVGLDPCELVDDAAVRALPGFAAAERLDSPGGHQCLWQTYAGDVELRVHVAFEAGLVPAAYNDDGNAEPIAGRSSVMNRFESVSSPAICLVETGHIPFPEPEEVPGVVEVASVTVWVPAAQLDMGCQSAKAVATALWPKLPPA